MSAKIDPGLEGIVAAETVLSHIDGDEGLLIIRGLPVENLAANARFEDVVHLLWEGFFEDLPEAEHLQTRLAEARLDAFTALEGNFDLIASRPPMEAVRAGLALAPDGDSFETAIGALATAGVLTACLKPLSEGRKPTAPNPTLSHAEDLLTIMTGTTPPREHVAGLNAYLVTVAEHGLNASTFAARVVASTQAGLLSATLGGISALKGPLHGGAPGPVLDMLDGIGTLDNAEAWIRSSLERGERLMGFGHRIYRTRDPRADALKIAAARLPRSAGRLALAEAIETTILKRLAAEKPDRQLDTNVEYYTAILLEALGFDRTAFTCVFAAARTAGWIAHAQEQLATQRIIRPQSVYIGPHQDIAA